MKMKICQNHWFHLILLTAIVWLVFSRTIGSYFLADDFGEIAYVNRICTGELSLLWLNFTSNFMSVPGMSVWRPWLLVSLLIDFLIWKANPVGFYLTNLLSYNVTVLLLYWLMRILTHSASKVRSCLTAFLTAALFAVSPLHCESVSWVVGRVDIVCAVFYLLCLCFFLQADRAAGLADRKPYRGRVVAYLTCFWISIWTKEMTIGAPVLAPALIFLFGSKPLDPKHTFKVSTPLWISTLVYFVLRYLALGTLLGGYTQGIGDSQAANALSRWLDFDTLHRLFFPFANGIYGTQPGLAALLSACYLVIFTVLVLRALSLKLNFKWLALLIVWIATCLAPLYKLWGLGYELEGARFCFFLTMPLAALVPALLLIENKTNHGKRRSRLEQSLTIVGLIATLLVGGILAKTAIRSNLEWVHAGNEVRKFLSLVGSLNKKAAMDGHDTIVLGIPKRRGGAHMILNGGTLQKGLRPPFTKDDQASNICTFDPLFFSERFPFDVTRFKRLSQQHIPAFYWNEELSNLQEIVLLQPKALPQLSVKKDDDSGNRSNCYLHSYKRISLRENLDLPGLCLDSIKDGDGIAFSGLDLPPLSADYLEARVRFIEPANDSYDAIFSANFDEFANGSQTNNQSEVRVTVKPEDCNKEMLVQIPLSKNWRWYTHRVVKNIFVQLPVGKAIVLNSTKFVSADEIQPAITITGVEQSKEGVYLIPEGHKEIELKVTLPPLTGIKVATINITAGNSFFDNFIDSGQAIAENYPYPTGLDHSGSIKLKVNTATFRDYAFHQINLTLKSYSGVPIGVGSDPITVSLTKSE